MLGNSMNEYLNHDLVTDAWRNLTAGHFLWNDDAYDGVMASYAIGSVNKRRDGNANNNISETAHVWEQSTTYAKFIHSSTIVID